VRDSGKADSAKSGLRDQIGNAVFVGTILLLWFVGPHVPGAQYVDGAVSTHATVLLIISIALASAGLILFVVGLSGLMLVKGQQMSRQDVLRESRRPQSSVDTAYRGGVSVQHFRGIAVGTEAYDEFSFTGLKQAWRSGAWRTDPQWRRRFIMTWGAVGIFYGVFGAMFAAGPIALRILALCAMIYSTVQTVRAFRRA
jgi:hypothetical protein